MQAWSYENPVIPIFAEFYANCVCYIDYFIAIFSGLYIKMSVSEFLSIQVVSREVYADVLKF